MCDEVGEHLGDRRQLKHLYHAESRQYAVKGGSMRVVSWSDSTTWNKLSFETTNVQAFGTRNKHSIIARVLGVLLPDVGQDTCSASLPRSRVRIVGTFSPPIRYGAVHLLL